MHAHLAKIVSEARLHECARGGIERLAGGAEDVGANGRHFVWFRAAGAALQHALGLLPAFRALTARCGRAAASAFALEQTGPRWRKDREWREAVRVGLTSSRQCFHLRESS